MGNKQIVVNELEELEIPFSSVHIAKEPEQDISIEKKEPEAGDKKAISTEEEQHDDESDNVEDEISDYESDHERGDDFYGLDAYNDFVDLTRQGLIDY